MHKAIVKTFLFWRSFQVMKGHQKFKHQICCCYCIPWVSSFHLICLKPQLKHFRFGGHQRSLEVIRRSNTELVAATVFPVKQLNLISFNIIKPQLKYFLFVEIIKGHQRSLEVISDKFFFILEKQITNQAWSQKIGRFEPKMKPGTPPPLHQIGHLHHPL